MFFRRDPGAAVRPHPDGGIRDGGLEEQRVGDHADVRAQADEAYLADMLTDRKYKEIAGTNLDKLELLIDALNPASERKDPDDFDFAF